MVTIKTKEEIDILREGGRLLAEILDILTKKVAPNMTTLDLEEYARTLIKERGAEPSFFGYKPFGAKKAYPAATCISINNEVVHGIPDKSRIIKEGDIVSIDCGIIYKNFFTDSAVTVGVGKIDSNAKKLLEATRISLAKGIDEARVGRRTGDIGQAVEMYAKARGFSIADNLGGHGVGYSQHEDPFIPNFGKPGQGVLLKPGMVIAIEPMLNEGTSRVRTLSDGYTFVTVDGKRSAHFEHTILITKEGPEILTIV
jgi:methionyl aminopeptidase